MKLNKTNLKILKTITNFNIDNNYLISPYFCFKITNNQAIELIKENFKLNNRLTFEEAKQFLVGNRKFYKMTKVYTGLYNDKIKIKVSNYESSLCLDLELIELFNLCNYDLFDSRKLNIENKKLYIEDYGIIMGLTKEF